MDEIVKEIGNTNNCTFCGVFRRQALDRGAGIGKYIILYVYAYIGRDRREMEAYRWGDWGEMYNIKSNINIITCAGGADKIVTGHNADDIAETGNSLFES